MSFESMKIELGTRVSNRMLTIREEHLPKGLLDALEVSDIKEEVRKVAANDGKDPAVAGEATQVVDGSEDPSGIPAELQEMFSPMMPGMAGAVKTAIGSMALAAREGIDSALAAIEVVLWEHEAALLALEQGQFGSDAERILLYGRSRATEIKLQHALTRFKGSIAHATSVIPKDRHINEEGLGGRIGSGPSRLSGYSYGPGFGG